MKKIWKETLQEIILTIITLGINLLVKGKKNTQKTWKNYKKRIQIYNNSYYSMVFSQVKVIPPAHSWPTGFAPFLRCLRRLGLILLVMFGCRYCSHTGRPSRPLRSVGTEGRPGCSSCRAGLGSHT